MLITSLRAIVCCIACLVVSMALHTSLSSNALRLQSDGSSHVSSTSEAPEAITLRFTSDTRSLGCEQRSGGVFRTAKGALQEMAVQLWLHRASISIGRLRKFPLNSRTSLSGQGSINIQLAFCRISCRLVAVQARLHSSELVHSRCVASADGIALGLAWW